VGLFITAERVVGLHHQKWAKDLQVFSRNACANWLTDCLLSKQMLIAH